MIPHSKIVTFGAAVEGACAEEHDEVARRWLVERKAFAVLGVMKGGTTAMRAHLLATAWEDNVSLPSYELHLRSLTIAMHCVAMRTQSGLRRKDHKFVSHEAPGKKAFLNMVIAVRVPFCVCHGAHTAYLLDLSTALDTSHY